MSTRVALSTFVMLVVMLLAPGCNPKSPEQEAIAGVWRQISDAWESRNGKAAVALSTKSTIDYYERIVKMGLNGTADQVRKLTPIERAEIVMMRNRGTRSELRKLDGKGYIEYATSQGWYSSYDDPDAPLYYELGKIKVGGDKVSAWAEVYFNDEDKKRKSDYAVKFFKEDGVWKLDETSIHLMLSHEYTRYAKLMNMTEDGFILMVEQMATGRKVPETIWGPMK